MDMNRNALVKHRTERLRGIVQHAYEHAPALRTRLGSVVPEDIQKIEDLEKIPVVRKEALIDLQSDAPPFGGLLAVDLRDLARVYQSPGPIYDPQGGDEDYWRFGEPLEIAGFGPGDIVMNTFSYHLSPAGFMLDDGLRRIGATVVPAGVGNTELQVQVIHDLKATGFVGTPSFLMTLMNLAQAQGTDFTIRKAYVTAEPFTSEQRDACAAHKLDVYQGYGTADAGSIAFECGRKAAMHVSTDFILEIVDPDTGKSLGPGEVGEVVVTSFNKTYPLIRFGIGDLSQLVLEDCDCGLVAERIAGFMGRIGDGFKVRGMFVYLRQVAEVVGGFSELGEFVVDIDRDIDRDIMMLRVEHEAPESAEGMREAFEQRLRAVLRVRVDRVDFVEKGALGSEQKLMDRRTWE